MEKALGQLKSVMSELDLDPSVIEIKEITTDREAVQERFIGSPTIRIDGRDLFEPEPGSTFSLNCRIYRLRDGRISPTPDTDDLKKALEEAKEINDGKCSE